LSAGDWDLWGNIFTNPSANPTAVYAWINSTSASAPDSSQLGAITSSSASLSNIGIAVPATTALLTVSTTYYLSVSSNFTGTCTVSGQLFARRRR
jgi:hypothetical protein